MLKFPYGNSDFQRLITENYFYVDRTHCLPLLEAAGDQLLFLRPRRFGKSLLLSMLENYYDVAKAGEFEKLFGHLAIGSQPTPKHNQYWVMKWDFSAVSSQGEVREIQQSLYDHLNGCIEQFVAHYRHLLDYEIILDPHNAIRSFQSVLAAVSQTPYRLYLLIDEYDKFANEVLMASPVPSASRYPALVTGEGILRTVFSAVKSASQGRGLERVFITGVSPLVLSDMTSGYNVSKSISLEPEFNELCGFTEAELQTVLNQIANECQFSSQEVTNALATMRTFYNGYCFSTQTPKLVYNPTLAIYFLEHFQKRCQSPEELLDSNLEMDKNKLAYISTRQHGGTLIRTALLADPPVIIDTLAKRFDLSELLKPDQDPKVLAALLYYFGVLTLQGRYALGKLALRIPNLVVRQLYVERLQELLLPDSTARLEVTQLAELIYQTGHLQPLCEFIESHPFSVFDNRDSTTATELILKAVFVALLFNSRYYQMDSETALGRRYADLIMIVHPNMRQYQLFDFLLEFKFLKLNDVKLTGEEVKQQTAAALKALPAVQTAVTQATTQLHSYRSVLQQTYGDPLRLRAYAVVAVGFERLVWEEV
jgi:hypothetical protein